MLALLSAGAYDPHKYEEAASCEATKRIPNGRRIAGTKRSDPCYIKAITGENHAPNGI